MKRTFFVLGITLLLALAFTVPALAGGWAVITLDKLPGEVNTNQQFEVGFMVRQHGVTPMKGQEPVITASLTGSKDSMEFFAHEEGEVGHYVAEIILPKAGDWEWSIAAFAVNQAMPSLTVVNAVPVASEAVKPTFNLLPIFATGLGVLGVLGGLLALQKKVRWAAALVLAGFIISGVGFASAADQPKAESEAQEVIPVTGESQVELGRDLFIAKGCMLCHSHVETNSIREFGVDMGPDLTNYTASREYLLVWLKDPSAAKPETLMPNLGLSEAEMDALIAFINSD